MRRKQIVLAELARHLSSQLLAQGLSGEDDQRHRGIDLRSTRDQLRLMLDGGWPWETVKTERKIYSVMFADLPFSHRAFKALSLLPAFAIPPRAFYSAREKFAQNGLYLRARKRWLPEPRLSHVKMSWR